MPDRPLPPHPVADGRVLDANIHLLDRAVLDRDGVPVLAVDDVEIDWPDDGGPVLLTSLVLGSGLTSRFFGAHQPRHTRLTVDWREVVDVGSAVQLGADRDDLDATWHERWLRDRVVGRIPGGRHDPR